MTEDIPPTEACGRPNGHPRITVILLAGLTLLLMTTGLAGGWFFQQINSKYSKLVAQTAADLNGVHDIAYHSGVSYAHLLELPPATAPEKREQLLQAIAADRAANDRVFADLRRTVADPRVRSNVENVIAKRQVFRDAADALISASGKSGALAVDSAISRRLLLTFEAYQDACDKLGDAIQSDSLQSSAAVSTEIGRLRLLFFGLAGVPLALAILLGMLILWLLWGTPVEFELRDANSRGGVMRRI